MSKMNNIILILINLLYICIFAILTIIFLYPNIIPSKNYNGRISEILKREFIFMDNKKKIDYFNKYEAKQAGFTLKLNKFAYLTKNEFRKLHGTRIPKDFEGINTPEAQKFLDKLLNNKNVPDSMDWRNQVGRVSDVKDQGMCESSWAFSATGSLEGQMLARNKSFSSLSEQNIMDCTKQIEYACMGGFISDAFSTISREGGVESEDSYPYVGQDARVCEFNKTKSVFNVDGIAYLKKGDENMLKQIVANFGPVSASIDAHLDSFKYYENGIYFEKHCNSDEGALDHFVLIVGYGSDSKFKQGDYWIVKNSWGKKWGDNGYIKMARNRDNNCGIATATAIPTFNN